MTLRLFYFTNLQSLHKSRSERETINKYNTTPRVIYPTSVPAKFWSVPFGSVMLGVCRKKKA